MQTMAEYSYAAGWQLPLRCIGHMQKGPSEVQMKAVGQAGAKWRKVCSWDEESRSLGFGTQNKSQPPELCAGYISWSKGPPITSSGVGRCTTFCFKPTRNMMTP